MGIQGNIACRMTAIQSFQNICSFLSSSLIVMTSSNGTHKLQILISPPPKEEA